MAAAFHNAMKNQPAEQVRYWHHVDTESDD
jgi:hypothetical protein